MPVNRIVQEEIAETPATPFAISMQSVDHARGLHNFIRIIARRRFWIIGAVVTGCVLAILASIVMVPIYKASTIIELNKEAAGGLNVDMGQLLAQSFGGSGEALQTDLQTETTILEGDSLALAVIEKLRLMNNPEFAAGGREAKLEAPEQNLSLADAPFKRNRLLKTFHAGLSVEPIHGTRLIRVSYESRDPRLATAIANELIDSYRSEYLKSHYDETKEVSDWLTGQLSDLKANVQDSEKKLADFEKQTGILNFGMMMAPAGGEQRGSNEAGIHSAVIEKLDAINAELTAAEASRIEKEAIYRLASSNQGDALVALASGPADEKVGSAAAAEIGILDQLRTQENSLKVSLANDSVSMGTNNRHIRELNTQIAEVNGQIQGEMQRVTRLSFADLQVANEAVKELQQEFDQQQAQASKLNGQTVEFAVLSQEAFSRKKLYEDLYTRLQEANVAAGIKATNTRVVEPAFLPAKPIRPGKMRNLLSGLVLGLLCGLICSFAMDRLDNRVSNPLEVEEITCAPVLGVVPLFGSNTRSRYGDHRVKWQSRTSKSREQSTSEPSSLWSLKHPKSVEAEAFRAIRTSILLSRPGGGIKVILVTGCVPGEGKSTVTANLAISFAQAGQKVVLVEADMRRPSMQHMMNVSNDAGLSDVLAGTRMLDEVILRGVNLPTLDVISAGPRPPMPAEMLGSNAFDELLAELKAGYDFVIIDGLPALVVTDAVLIASKSDATVWVVRAGEVTRPQLARAAQIIGRNRMPVIGFIFNGMDRTLDPYGPNYSYTYGYDDKHYGAYYGDGENADEV